jgi:hypothetical protein
VAGSSNRAHRLNLLTTLRQLHEASVAFERRAGQPAQFEIMRRAL